MQKKLKKITCIVMSCVMVMLPIRVNAINTCMIQQDLGDLQILKYNSGGIIYEAESATNLVPIGAEVNEVFLSNSSQILYIDYNVDGVRYVDEYLPEGSTRKNVVDDFVVTTSYKNNITYTNVYSTPYRYSMDMEMITSIKKAIENDTELENIDGILINEIDGKTIITPDIDDVDKINMFSTQTAMENPVSVLYPIENDFPAYNAKNVLSKSAYISALGATRNAYVFETQDYYTTVSADYIPIVRDTTLLGISVAVSWPLSAVSAVLSCFNGLIIADTLVTDILFYTANDTEYWFALEGGVFDTTAENAIVQVCVEQDWGTFQFGLDKNNNPTWIRYSGDYPLPFTQYAAIGDYETIWTNAVIGYNANIELYGVWKWGKGVFGG